VPAATLPELAGDIEADVKMPLMVFTALAFEPHPRWELRFDHRFINRAAASSTDLVVVEATSPDVMDTTLVKGYYDRQSFGLRLARSLAEGRGRAALRTRYENNSVPEQTVTPSNMDFQKLEIGLAGSWALSRRVLLTGQVSHYFLWSRRVDESLHRPLAEPSLDEFNHPSPTGTYTGVADYVAFWMSVLL
jgi:hypothetical protein